MLSARKDGAQVRRNRLSRERSTTIDAGQLALRIMASQRAVNTRDRRERRVDSFGKRTLRMGVRTDFDERAQPGLRPPCLPLRVIRGTARVHGEEASGVRRQ